jgi:hypothetical protein
MVIYLGVRLNEFEDHMGGDLINQLVQMSIAIYFLTGCRLITKQIRRLQL